MAKQVGTGTLKGGVTAPKGFVASGIHAGLKPSPLLDLALLVSEVEGPVAGLFTRNHIVAAPVTLDRRHLQKGLGRAILINSGNANAFTGRQGLRDAREMANSIASRLRIPTHTVFVASTGVIGQPLPMAIIRRGIPRLFPGLNRAGHREAARAMMTTDTKIKEFAIQGRIGNRMVTVGGMAKGAGMIHPNMATMLAVLTTDAAITQPALQQSLARAVSQSFNAVSVDGDTSTNDTVLCFSNGLAGNERVTMGSPDLARFQKLLHEACQALALQICRDGEGATKLVTIQVVGARTAHQAKRIAETVATSPLVKTAFFGEDPNWGRIVAAVGRAGPPVHPTAIGLEFDGIPVVRNGKVGEPAVERTLRTIMRKREFSITIRVGRGRGAATMWTTDLSYDYIKINASYRS